MPRRKLRYYRKGTFLFNGQTAQEAIATPISIDDIMRLPGRRGHNRSVPGDVADVVEKFDELTLTDREALIRDLCNEVAFARTMRLDLLTKGRNSKPHEWTLQILFRGVRTAMERQGLKAAVSEYETAGRENKRSTYLCLAAEIAKIAGLRVPKDVKGVARRSKRIAHSVVPREVLQSQERAARAMAKLCSSNAPIPNGD